MTERTRTARVKVLMAVVGGGAAVVMGGLAVVTDVGPGPDSAHVASPILPGPMTQGDTVTTTIPPAALIVGKAAPTVKAPRFGG